ncbi:MAG: phosphatase PAP2 family protein [Myxococcota bacterium]
MESILAWDRDTQRMIEGLSGGWLDAPMMVLSTLGFFVPVLLVAWVWLVLRGGPLGRGLALVAVAMVVITDQGSAAILKPLIGRPRPHSPAPGFPSSHASNLFAQAMLFSRCYPRLTPILFTIATLTGFSRVYLGKHYPLDVLAGAFFGVGCGWVAAHWLRGHLEITEAIWSRIASRLPASWAARIQAEPRD